MNFERAEQHMKEMLPHEKAEYIRGLSDWQLSIIFNWLMYNEAFLHLTTTEHHHTGKIVRDTMKDLRKSIADSLESS